MGSTEAEVAALLTQAKAEKQIDWLIYIRRRPGEAPRHRVRITKPFWLGRHEVTRGQFGRFVESRRYQTEAERNGQGGYGFVNDQWIRDSRFIWNADHGAPQANDHPVVNVSWEDVTAFCQYLSEVEGLTYDLPAEAQWEYACRAGTTTSWHCANNDTKLREYAWFSANSGQCSHPVGQLLPNPWGLHDMHGNVWEWCRDWWVDRYYAASPMDDPIGDLEGSLRVRRGGSWRLDAPFTRAPNRDWMTPDYRSSDLGFRVVRELSFSSE